jgi:hypothetical protein
MTNLISKYGKSIIYITEIENIASNKIAQKNNYKLIDNRIIGFINCYQKISPDS